MMPPDLNYIDSWLASEGDRCFQLMETDNRALLCSMFCSVCSCGSHLAVSGGTAPETTNGSKAGNSGDPVGSVRIGNTCGEKCPLHIQRTVLLVTAACCPDALVAVSPSSCCCCGSCVCADHLFGAFLRVDLLTLPSRLHGLVELLVFFSRGGHRIDLVCPVAARSFDLRGHCDELYRGESRGCRNTDQSDYYL